MGRRCSVCSDARRAKIDQAIIERTSLSEISREYGLSEDSLSRHRSGHMKNNIAEELAPISSNDVKACNDSQNIASIHTEISGNGGKNINSSLPAKQPRACPQYRYNPATKRLEVASWIDTPTPEPEPAPHRSLTEIFLPSTKPKNNTPRMW